MTSKDKAKKVTVVPHHQYDNISPATKLLEKRRNMYEVHEAFEKQKDEYRKDEQNFKDIEQNIRKRDVDIQVQLVEFCQFLQQNEIKRKKAEQRLKQQENLYNSKLVEIKVLEKQHDELTRQQKRFETKLAALRKYEEYLERVRSTYSDQYPQMNDILNRYQTLKKANNDLLKERETMEANHAALKIEASNFEKEINQSILQISNESKELSRKLEDKINERNELQSDVEQTNELASKKNLNLGKILMAVDNLFYRCSQGNQRIKYQSEEHKADKKNDPKKQGKQTEKQKKKQQAPEDEASYETKTKLAAQKLKSIFSYMKDFKIILDEYRKANAPKKT